MIGDLLASAVELSLLTAAALAAFQLVVDRFDALRTTLRAARLNERRDGWGGTADTARRQRRAPS